MTLKLRCRPEAIVPVPAIIQRRAWEAAFLAGAEHSARLVEALSADEGGLAWHWLQAMVVAGPATFTWSDCATAFATYRTIFAVRV